MADQALLFKLNELSHDMEQMKQRIANSSNMTQNELLTETKQLREDILKESNSILDSLRHSKISISNELKSDLTALQQNLNSLIATLKDEYEAETDSERLEEKKALLAEYGLDTAVIVSNYALLLSFEAMKGESHE